MWRTFYEGNPLMGFALFSLLFFVVFFISAVVRTMRSPAPRIDSLAAMPLMDDDTTPTTRSKTETIDVR